MTPFPEAVTELRLVVDGVAVQARRLAHPSFSDMQDLRTEALGALMDAMDRADPGLGTRLQLLLYPRLDALAAGAELGRSRASQGTERRRS